MSGCLLGGFAGDRRRWRQWIHTEQFACPRQQGADFVELLLEQRLTHAAHASGATRWRQFTQDNQCRRGAISVLMASNSAV